MESSTNCGGGAEIRRQIERQPGGVQVREFGGEGEEVVGI
jgi:hypothetical protein